MSADHARAILRMRRGYRATPETAPIPCSWCDAGADRPCRDRLTMTPRMELHEARRAAWAAAQTPTPEPEDTDRGATDPPVP